MGFNIQKEVIPLNEDNLRVPTSEEAREIGRKGGIASGKARRERKAFKEALLLALETMTEEGKTIQEKGIESLMKKYIDGDLQAFTIVRDTVGEKPTDKVEADVNSEVKINIELSDE